MRTRARKPKVPRWKRRRLQSPRWKRRRLKLPRWSRRRLKLPRGPRRSRVFSERSPRRAFNRDRKTRRNRRGLRIVNLLAAALACVAVLTIAGFGYRTIPALGPALDPGRGAWASAADGKPVTSQSLHVTGLTQPTTISFTKQGIASVQASNTHDEFLALGYLHARFRLSEMDLERRLGEGRLAELGGEQDLASDEFELRLGLLRTAQVEWTRTTGLARQALLAYAQGVNDDIARVRQSGDWPAVFALPGVYPRPWTPTDSLVVQGVLTQELDLTAEPLDYALLVHALGKARAMNWFPVIAANKQTPYDPGPYENAGLTPLPPDAASSAPLAGLTAAGAGTTHRSLISARTAGSLLAQLSRLPAGRLHRYPDSNAWAANGPAVAGGGALLAGDPHLPQTVPSVWYEVALSAPGYAVAGVSVPGLPGVLLGHNAHIAWSLTDTQNQATFYYAERVRGSRYFWRDSWRPMTKVRYVIPVRGGATVRLTVPVTVHGPVITQAGQTMAVDWMGNVPSDDLGAMLAVNQASTFDEFKAALAGWHAPTQNFVYADARNIGVLAAGYYPQVARGCEPWLPLDGTGGCDVTGTIPYVAVPQAYNPPSHVIVTANQRPVTAAYPYYIGTSADFFDPGYRAAYAYAFLESHRLLRAGDLAALQNSLTDELAVRVLPRVLDAVRGMRGAALLASWDGSMSAGSVAATLWWRFWSAYLHAAFGPLWKSVPVARDASLSLGVGLVPLDEDLEAWTLGGTAPSGVRGSAVSLMRSAFASAVSSMSSSPGSSPAGSSSGSGSSPAGPAWGQVHSRSFPALSGAAGLGYGPRAAGGDPFTEDAADGGMDASTGPSWRMIVTPGSSVSVGVYPGGQSENPGSPWYLNLVPLWWNGQYLPLPVPGEPAGPLRWSLSGGAS